MKRELQVSDVLEGLKHTYMIEAERGRGGFGITWQATDEEGQVVIVKQLRLDKIDSWKTLELFHREAKVLETLSHPQIPDYIEFFAWDGERPQPIEPGAESSGALFLVQKFIEGKNLSEHLSAGRRFGFAEVRDILKQTLGVLVYLHQLSPPVIHRDLHPKNLILGSDNKVYLIDFGAMQDQLKFGDEMGSTTVGTFGFIPLEQSMGRAQAASDLYALGMTILSLISGRSPHELPLDEAKGKVRVDQVIQDPDLQRVVGAMVEPLTGQRVRSASEALELLENPRAIAPTNSRSRTPVPREPTASVPARRVYKILAGGSAGCAVVMYGAFFNSLSETQLVGIAPIWFVPMAIGISGLFMQYKEKPYTSAAIMSVAVVFGFLFFLYGIFPGM